MKWKKLEEFVFFDNKFLSKNNVYIYELQIKGYKTYDKWFLAN